MHFDGADKRSIQWVISYSLYEFLKKKKRRRRRRKDMNVMSRLSSIDHKYLMLRKRRMIEHASSMIRVQFVLN